MIDLAWKYLTSSEGVKDELIQLSKAVYIRIYKCLNDECSEWPTIVKVAIRDGIEKAEKLLQNAKGSIVEVLKKHKSLVRSLTQGAVKGGAKMTAKCVAKRITKEGGKAMVSETTRVATQELVIEGGKRLVSEGAKQVATQGVKQGLKSLGKGATGVGIAADVAQAGLEHYGYKKTGKAVGASGNMASGAMAGGAIGGPPGAFIGALVAVLIWGAVEAAGTGINKAIEQ